MNKRLSFVLAILFFARTFFSEIPLAPNLSLSPSIESSAGFLIYETGNESWFHTEKFNARLNILSDKKEEQSAVSMEARYLYGKSDRTDLNGKLHFGSAKFAFEKEFFKIRAGGGIFGIPQNFCILKDKPRFILNDSRGFFATTGGNIKFNFFDNDWNIDADFVFGRANVASGDMYYFYGRADDFLLFGGKAAINAPFGISFFTLAGNLEFNLKTDKNKRVGNLDASICAFYLAKEFHFRLADYFSIKPFAGYAQLSANGSAWLTSVNQTYFLFPFKYAGGNFDGKIHFISAGLSFDIKKGGFAFSLDFIYLASIKNSISGIYAYQFKKSVFFDGSSDIGCIQFPDTAGSHIFAGIMEASYKFNLHKNFVPTIKISKIFAAAILNEETKNFMNGDSSYTTATVPSSQPYANSDNSSSIMEMIKSALLSGTYVSIKIDF